jgi:hypothetical protein
MPLRRTRLRRVRSSPEQAIDSADTVHADAGRWPPKKATSGLSIRVFDFGRLASIRA